MNHFFASTDQRWCLHSLFFDQWDETQLGPNSVEECETQSRPWYPKVNNQLGAVFFPPVFYFFGSYNLEEVFCVLGLDFKVNVWILGT